MQYLYAVPLFVPEARSFVPACACAGAPRARGRQGWPSRLLCLLLPASPGHALTGPSTARHSSSSGRHLVCPDALEFALLVENRPGDAGKLVGERDRQHIVVQTFFGSLDPGLEPIAVPMLWPDPDQYDPGCLHEQRAQIAIAAPGYLAEDGTVSRRYLLWHQLVERRGQALAVCD